MIHGDGYYGHVRYFSPFYYHHHHEIWKSLEGKMRIKLTWWRRRCVWPLGKQFSNKSVFKIMMHTFLNDCVCKCKNMMQHKFTHTFLNVIFVGWIYTASHIGTHITLWLHFSLRCLIPHLSLFMRRFALPHFHCCSENINHILS